MHPMIPGVELSKVVISGLSINTSATGRRDHVDSTSKLTVLERLHLLQNQRSDSSDSHRVQTEISQRSLGLEIHFRPVSLMDKGAHVCVGTLSPATANKFILNGSLYALIALQPVSELVCQ